MMSGNMNNRFTVSRLVSDPVKTEAAEKIAQKEIEQLRLNLDEACKDEYEQNVESCGKKSLLLEKTTEIAGLRRELELISKLLTGHADEALEGLQHKISGSIVSASSVWDANGKLRGSATSTPEKSADLSQLSREELINHFKSEMIQLKREHDYTIQEMTEEYFSIKRRCLNLEERGSFSCLKKDKEFDALRKKIPNIISKLEKVLSEGEKSLLESLLLENRQLKDSLSEADEKMSRLSQVEENHRKLIRKLESDVEASIYGDLYWSIVNQIQCSKKEASESKIDLEDSFVESCMAQECCAVIYKEALKEADKIVGCLNMNVSEKEEALRSEMVEKERLKEEIHWLECLVKEKEDLVQIAENDLATEREKLEIVSQQSNNLQIQIDQQEVVIIDKNNELKAVSARALEITEGYDMDTSELRQKLELVRKNMKTTENEKVKSELKLSSSEAEQKRLQNQFVSSVLSLDKWSQGFDSFECLVAKEMKKIDSRLESMQSQLSDLLDDVDELNARESMYKQLMEKKTCDLQKAETEVDLLGDEIEALLDLLKKIYIALDHYSPILKHYPGIMEILKLVRRELRGESKRISVF
uniref:WPP domain-associated protein n=1 Tax=Noccaea caerulescens TaxID=107243 RepID=A0A1J3D2F6_NOCCA